MFIDSIVREHNILEGGKGSIRSHFSDLLDLQCQTQYCGSQKLYQEWQGYFTAKKQKEVKRKYNQIKSCNKIRFPIIRLLETLQEIVKVLSDRRCNQSFLFLFSLQKLRECFSVLLIAYSLIISRISLFLVTTTNWKLTFFFFCVGFPCKLPRFGDSRNRGLDVT